jgi:hypothetical protein
MKLLLLFAIFGMTFASAAEKYKCYSSKYPENMSHYFEEGYTLLSINNDVVNLKYYVLDKKSNIGRLVLNSNYQTSTSQGGQSKIKGYKIALLENVVLGTNPIDKIYLEPILFNSNSQEGMVGKFTFSGQSYLYDWNVCYKSFAK